MSSSYKKNKGFTLIEIMVVMTILIVITFISSDYIKNVYRASVFNDEQQTAVHNARRAVNIINKEVRGANSSEMGDYPLFNINDDDFGFYSDINNNGNTEKIRYYLDNINYKLLKSVTEAGEFTDYTGTTTVSTIANFVNNQEEAIFLYCDGSGAETSVINEIRLIKTILKINVTPWRSPLDYYVESSVNLRNLKTNL